MAGAYPEISLFGGLRIRAPGGGAEAALSTSARELFAYLVTCAGKPVHRERVADVFWPELDEERSRAALSTAVWRINKTVRALCGLTLHSRVDALVLEIHRETSVDVRIMEGAVRRALEVSTENPQLPGAIRVELAAAVELHAGPFMEGSASAWAAVERERLSSLHLRGLALLMQDCGLRRDYEGALEYGRRVLGADPFREQVQCEVMWLHMLSGQRARALMQYRSYQSLLARELGIEPMAEMRALAEHIQRDPDVEQRFTDAHAALRSPNPLAEFLASVERSRLETYRALRAV